MKRTLILASESPRRRELLRRLGAEFEVMPAHADELETGENPEKLPQMNALLKAAAVAEKFPEAFVLGADTGVFEGGIMLGKPRSEEEALSMLLSLSGKSHKVISGVALICRKENVELSWSVTSGVAFGNFTSAEAAEYMKQVNVMDKAGSYAIQEHPELLGARWEGELENIIGLPVVKLKEVLEKYGLTTSRR